MSTWVSILVVLALILVEAFFVAAEISLVSLREQQVRTMAERGRRGARVARLVSDPNRFLAAVQLGVTLAALLSSAFGALTLSSKARVALVHAGLRGKPATFIGFVGVTLVITLVTLVIGELAPKRLALQRAEGAAQLFAPVLDVIARISRPVIWLLSAATNATVRLLGGDPGTQRQAITEEELRGLVAAHEALTPDERNLIGEVFAAGERMVREVMIPRTEVTFLDGSVPVAQAVEDAVGQPHSRYPVVRGSHDDVVGFVHVRDLFAVANRDRTVGEVSREVMMIPSSRRVLAALSDLRRSGQHLAIVVDEYGGTAGIVTLEDLFEELVGEIRDEYDLDVTASALLTGGEVEVDGLLNLDEFTEATGYPLPEGPYETAAGFVVNGLGHVPHLGESVETELARLTVARMDGRRVERLRVTPLVGAPGTPAEP